ncbi:hypothetical protein N1031_06945 [Herbiconiux moechotypicola]|uniref:Tape measure protein n=1 Tax=Herbiconiux moechotypicola TaxID=637393 RepID=A0ABN3DG18_9MICO|nr:hypothetical protein [Herbiconiux moechotypicola]MCS5729493.1 hypothetical protein [Herbiconiux moechotypicola]
MTNIGYATLDVIPSLKGMGSKLTQGVAPAMRSAGVSGGNTLGQTLVGTAGGFLIGKMAELGLSAAGGFVKSVIAGAADLEQSVGAIDAVFKGSAGQMHEWSQSAATDVGLTKNEFNELGTLIGAQLKNGGTAMDQLAPKTNELIGLGADLSSMFGGTTRDAVDALSAALKGERDPIERYGVSLNQARVDAKAAELGFQKVGGALSQEANQAATIALIMEQTADAHGNFAREADTLAHKQQVLNAMWQDGKTKLGEAFLPAASAAAGVLISVLGPAIESTTSFVNEAIGGITAFGAAWRANDGDVTSSGFPGFMERMANTLRPIFDSFGPMFATIGTSFQAALAPLAPVFAALLPQLVQLWTSFSPFSLLLQAITPILPQVAAMVAQLASTLGGALGTALTSILPVLTSLAQTLTGTLGAALQAFVPVVNRLIAIFSGSLSTTIEALMPVIVEIATVLGGVLGSVLSSLTPVISMVAEALGTILGVVSPLISGIMPLVSAVLKLVAPLIQLTGAILTPLIGLFTALLGPIIKILEPILALVTPLLDLVMVILQPLIDLFTALIGIIGPLLTPIIEALEPILTGVADSIGAVLTPAIGVLTDVLGGLIEFLTGVFTGDWEKAWGGIVQIFEGIWNGIGEMAKGALNGLIDIVNGLIGGVNSITGAVGIPEIPLIPGLANGGTVTRSGTVLVGERGPELLRLPKGAEVDPDISSATAFRSPPIDPSTAANRSADERAGAEIHVHPAPGMSEEAIGKAAKRELDFDLKLGG